VPAATRSRHSFGMPNIRTTVSPPDYAPDGTNRQRIGHAIRPSPGGLPPEPPERAVTVAYATGTMRIGSV